MYIIYALVDPRDYLTRYIGVTENLSIRLKTHLRCDGTNTAKDEWMRDMEQHGVMVIMQTLEQVKTWNQARKREDFWIAYYLNFGSLLVNISLPHKAKFHQEVQSPSGRQRGFVEAIQMLAVRYDTVSNKERAFPQKGIWIYECDSQIRRYYKREYPEFFTIQSSKQSARIRAEKQVRAIRIFRERREATTRSLNEKIHFKIFPIL